MCVLWSDITEPEHPEDKTSPVQCCTEMCTLIHRLWESLILLEALPPSLHIRLHLLHISLINQQ